MCRDHEVSGKGHVAAAGAESGDEDVLVCVAQEAHVLEDAGSHCAGGGRGGGGVQQTRRLS